MIATKTRIHIYAIPAFIAALFILASALSTMETAANATEGESLRSVAFYMALGLASVLGASFLFDAVRREDGSNMIRAIISMIVVLPVIVLMTTHSSVSDYLQVSTVLQRGSTERQQMETAEKRQQAAIDAAKAISDAAAAAVPDADGIKSLRGPVVVLQAQLAKQNELISAEEQNGGCKARCQAKMKIRDQIKIDLDAAQARLTAAEEERNAALEKAAKAAAEYQALLTGHTGEKPGEEPAEDAADGERTTGQEIAAGGVARTFRANYQEAIDRYMPEKIWDTDPRAFLALLATLTMNAGAVVCLTYAYKIVPDDADMARPATVGDIHRYMATVAMMQGGMGMNPVALGVPGAQFGVQGMMLPGGMQAAQPNIGMAVPEPAADIGRGKVKKRSFSLFGRGSRRQGNKPSHEFEEAFARGEAAELAPPPPAEPERPTEPDFGGDEKAEEKEEDAAQHEIDKSDDKVVSIQGRPKLSLPSAPADGADEGAA